MLPSMPQNLIDGFWFHSPVTATIRTDFPHPMTPVEFESTQRRFIHVEQIMALAENFKQSGKITMENPLRVYGDHSIWQMRFNSYQSYREWDQLTGSRGLVNDSQRKAMGFGLKVSIDYV